MKQINYIVVLVATLISGNLWGTVNVSDLKGLKNALNSADMNITLKASITISENLELDLKGKTITATTNSAFKVTNATLSLYNGTIKSTGTGSAYSISLQTKAKVVLQDISISSTYVPIANFNGDALTFNKGVKLQGGKYDFLNVSSQYGANLLSITNNDVLTFNKVMLVKSCTITNKGSLTFANIISSANSNLKLVNSSAKSITIKNADLKQGTLAIDNAGVFTIADGSYINLTVRNTGTITVTGGLFATGTSASPLAYENIKTYIDPSCKAIEASIGTTPAKLVMKSVVPGEAICEGVEYMKLEAAIQAANQSRSNNPVVKVIKDVDSCSTFYIDKNMTLSIGKFNISMISSTDRIIVREGIFTIRGNGQMNNSIEMEGTNASLDVDSVVIVGNEYGIGILQANSIKVGLMTTINKGIVSMSSTETKHCNSISNSSNCSICLTNTYIGTITSQGSGTVEIREQCLFPKTSYSLKAFVPSNHTVMLQKDKQYGDVYIVLKGVLPIIYKVGEYEYPGSTLGLNQALEISSQQTPAVLQANITMNAAITTSGYLNLNGKTMQATSKEGWKVKNCTITIMDTPNYAGLLTCSNQQKGSVVLTIDTATVNIQHAAIGDGISQFGIYVTGKSYVNVVESQIKGSATGIEICNGELNVQNSTISTTSHSIGCNPSNTSPTTAGAAIAVVQTMAKQPIFVHIDNGTLVAPMALIQVNPLNSTEADLRNLSIKVKGGWFTSTHTTAGTLIENNPDFGTIIYTNNDMVISPKNRVFLSGGYYNYDPKDYVDNGFASTEITLIPLSRRTEADIAAAQAGYKYKVIDENDVCYPNITTLYDTLCLNKAQDKYPTHDIKHSCSFTDTLTAHNGCDSVVMYNVYILAKPILPNLEDYMDLIDIKCGSSLHSETLLTAVKKAAMEQRFATTAQLDDIWLEVRWPTSSQFTKVDDTTLITIDMDYIQLRLVGLSECQDTIYGHTVISKVTYYTPDNTPELDNMPAVRKYNSWLLMININQLTAMGYKIAEEDVTWYEVVGEMDPTTAIIDDKIVGYGYYYTANQSLTRSYYAIMVDRNSACGNILRTRVIDCSAAQSKAQQRIYTIDGQLVDTKTIRRVGMYLLRTDNGEQSQTDKLIITH